MKEKLKTTISINGGPTVPVDLALAAVDAVTAKPQPFKTEVHQLMCQLTDDEQRARGVELATSQKLLTDLTEEKKSIGGKINNVTAKINQLAETVKHKQEERPVVCLLEPDYAADSMTIRRTDNWEINCIRQMTHSERQPELPLEEKKEVTA